jgi:hypothetical protein
MMKGPMDRYVPLPPLPVRVSRLNELAYDRDRAGSARAVDDADGGSHRNDCAAFCARRTVKAFADAASVPAIKAAESRG